MDPETAVILETLDAVETCGWSLCSTRLNSTARYFVLEEGTTQDGRGSVGYGYGEGIASGSGTDAPFTRPQESGYGLGWGIYGAWSYKPGSWTNSRMPDRPTLDQGCHEP